MRYALDSIDRARKALLGEGDPDIRAALSALNQAERELRIERADETSMRLMKLGEMIAEITDEWDRLVVTLPGPELTLEREDAEEVARILVHARRLRLKHEDVRLARVVHEIERYGFEPTAEPS